MTTTTPPGWYDDPEDSSGQRYWDGQAWTPHRQQKPVSPPAGAPSLPPLRPAPANVGYPPPAPQQAAWPSPGYPPAGPSPQRSNNPVVLIGAVVAVVVLVVGGCFALFFLAKDSASPEDQIRDVVQREFANFNASKFSHDPAIQCKANAASDDQEAKEGPKILAEGGTVSASVSNIHVSEGRTSRRHKRLAADSATADVTLSFSKAPGKSKTVKFQFVKEDGSWKECTSPSSSDDDSGSGN